MTIPKLSVIMPVYERRTHIEIALRSVLVDNKADRDIIEVIVVDNASPTLGLEDQVAGISEKFTGEAGFVGYHRWDHNLGLYPSVNRAVWELVDAPYVHVLHEDDYVLPGFYEEILKAIEICPSAGVISTAHRNLHSADGSFNGPQSLSGQPGVLGSRLIARLLLANPIQVCSVVFRHDVFEMIGPFRPDLPHTADWEWYMRAALAMDWYYIPTPLAVFRIHTQQDSYRNDRDGRAVHDIRRTYETFSEMIPAHFESYLRTGRVTSAQRAISDAYNVIQEGNVDLAVMLLTDAMAMLRPQDVKP